MARKPRLLFEGGIYHITFRGNAQQEIFTDVRDRKRMLENIAECCDTYSVRVFLYCLMPNHVHLLLETPKGNLDRFMGSLLTGYSVYFNRKHQRSGHVMQGRYGAQVVAGDEYLLNLSRYIHLNPVKTDYWSDKTLDQKLEFLHQFAWSSYRAYIGLAKPEEWLAQQPLLEQLNPTSDSTLQKQYQRFVEAGLSKNDDEFRRLVKGNPLAIGPEDFVTDIRKKYAELAESHIRREDVALRKIASTVSKEQITEAVAAIVGSDPQFLKKSRTSVPERVFFALALEKFGGLTQREIAQHIGVTSGAAVCSMTKRHALDEKVVGYMERLQLTFKG